MIKNLDLIGHRFSRLVVVRKHSKDPTSGKTFWMCRCDCGNTAIRSTSKLRSGQTHSCGCANFTHRCYGIPGYSSWRCMLNRCYRKSDVGYPRYGGAGLRVCEFLRATPVNLLILIGQRPHRTTLDRINNDLGYSCGQCAECISKGWTLNVRWATWTEQNLNRRCTLYEVNGVSRTAREWARICGLHVSTVRWRLKKGTLWNEPHSNR